MVRFIRSTCAFVQGRFRDCLARFRGHFYNWYGTRDLRPLDPPYISSVDSGNLAGHLIELANARREWRDHSLTDARRLTGIADALDLAREDASRLDDGLRTQTVILAPARRRSCRPGGWRWADARGRRGHAVLGGGDPALDREPPTGSRSIGGCSSRFGDAPLGSGEDRSGVGARGRYGFYEALDCIPARVPKGKSVAIVRGFMAHHLGMTIVAIADALLDGVMRARFHAEPIVQATELLLQEQTPRDVAVARPLDAETKSTAIILNVAPPGGSPPHTAQFPPHTCCRTDNMH
jgi:hypothetical protein